MHTITLFYLEHNPRYEATVVLLYVRELSSQLAARRRWRLLDLITGELVIRNLRCSQLQELMQVLEQDNGDFEFRCMVH